MNVKKNDAPVEDIWVKWDGRDPEGPLKPDTIVKVRVRGGYEHSAQEVSWWAGNGLPQCSNWARTGDQHDIIAYLVVEKS